MTGEFKIPSKYVCDDLALFGGYFPKRGTALVHMPNFEFHQKQSSISKLSNPHTFAAKTLQMFASFSEFWKDCLVPDRNLIDISYELGLTHYEIIQVIQFKGDFLANHFGGYQSEREKAKCCVRRKEEKQEERVSRSLSNRTPPRPHHYHYHCWYNFYWIWNWILTGQTPSTRKTIGFFVNILSIDFNRTRNTNLPHFNLIGRCSLWRKKIRMVQCWSVRDGQLFPLRLDYYLSLSLIMV